MADKLASLKHDSTKKSIIAAYESYERREPNSLDVLLKLVINFAKSKVSHVEYDLQYGSGAEDADDWAQEVSIKVWQELTKNSFRGTPTQFYDWVHKIAFRRGINAFNELLEEKQTNVPMFVEIEEENEKGRTEKFTEENPLIHAGADGYGRHTLIPADVEGVNRDICNLLLTEVQDQIDGEYVMRGRNYAEVGFVLGMTEAAVQMRMQRLRKETLGNMSSEEFKKQKRAEREAKRLEAELEAKNSVSIGLAKIRGKA